MKHEYEDMSMLTLPETIAQSLYCFVRLSLGVSACSYMSSYSCFIFHPYLVSYPFFFVGCRHGNDCIHMRTKFHLHVCYTEQVIGVKK